MREQLNQIANALTDLAAIYEEKNAPVNAWETEEWKELLQRIHDSDDSLDVLGETPIYVTHTLFMRIGELTAEMIWLREDRDALQRRLRQDQQPEAPRPGEWFTQRETAVGQLNEVVHGLAGHLRIDLAQEIVNAPLPELAEWAPDEGEQEEQP